MKINVPSYAPIFSSVICPICGEKTYKPVMHNGKNLCKECAEANYYVLNGKGIQQNAASSKCAAENP